MKLRIRSKTSTAQPLKFGNGYVGLSHTLLGMWLVIHVGIKVNLHYEMGTRRAYEKVKWCGIYFTTADKTQNIYHNV